MHSLYLSIRLTMTNRQPRLSTTHSHLSLSALSWNRTSLDSPYYILTFTNKTKTHSRHSFSGKTNLIVIPDLQSGEARIVAHEWWGSLDEGVGQGHHREWGRPTHARGAITVHGHPRFGHLHLGSIHEWLPCWDLEFDLIVNSKTE